MANALEPPGHVADEHRVSRARDTVRILVVDPDAGSRAQVCAALEPEGFELRVAEGARQARRILCTESVDILITEKSLSGVDGLDLFAEARRLQPALAAVVVTAFGTVEDAVTAMRAGAADFLSKPYTDEQLRLAVERTLEGLQLRRENESLREALDDRLRLDNLIATDARMQAIFKTVKAVARTRTTVLVTGESGTGKTLVARAIHALSERRDGPFVEVNCGALPESLLESELFGHVRGAFTGAVKDRPGKFEAADGGTIFLDEIATSSASFQVRLLRVLQDRVVERVGDTTPIPVDVRVVLATNANLEQEVREGRFREDLYYRINVVGIEMPPLRERRDDIPFLAEHFLRRFAAENGKRIRGFSEAALARLAAAPWPGNVRQLENVVERAVVLCEGERIEAEDLPVDLGRSPRSAKGWAELLTEDLHLMPLRKALEIPEKLILERALEHHGGNRQETAASLGINRSTLFNKMRKHGLL